MSTKLKQIQEKLKDINEPPCTCCPFTITMFLYLKGKNLGLIYLELLEYGFKVPIGKLENFIEDFEKSLNLNTSEVPKHDMQY